MNEEFKSVLPIQNGEMSDREMAFEEELEKLEVYQELIESEMQDDREWDVGISPEKQKPFYHTENANRICGFQFSPSSPL